MQSYDFGLGLTWGNVLAEPTSICSGTLAYALVSGPPADVSLAGFTTCTQGAHLGTLAPFALTNSQDLTLGF